MKTRIAMFLLAQDCSQFPNTYHESIYRGKLTPSCITHYHRLYISKDVPPRAYPYFHEIENGETRRNRARGADVEVDWRILGGYQLDIRKAAYTVLYGLHCGGTLIAPDWVITAAHCKKQKY